MIRVFHNSKWILAVIVFAACVAPTYISYRPYVFRWDDSGYLQMSIAVSRALWSGNAHGTAHLREIAAAMYSFRPPAMTLMGVPWGPLKSWDAAGKCFITLYVEISFWAAVCLFLLARIGIKPLFLALASICVFASLGPVPPGSTANDLATSFMADSLFSWIILAALLLIPYEAKTRSLSTLRAFLRGVGWGLVLSAGALTKISFLYFVILIVPVLLIIRFRRSGPRKTVWAVVGLAVSSAPAAGYLLKFGGASLANGRNSSFGGVASLYYSSLPDFLSYSLSHTHGLWIFVGLVAAALGYLAIKRREFVREPAFLALLIVGGFAVIVLASPNRLIRFLFPVIVVLPFLLGVLLSGNGSSIHRRSALLMAGLACCGLSLVALPARQRAERSASLGRSDAVLEQAVECDDRSILLATDSPTLNPLLMSVSTQVTRMSAPIQVRTLIYSSMNHIPIDSDFHAMQDSDLVVFQDDNALSPPFTNLRVPEYKSFILQQTGYSRTKIWDDVNVYSRHCLATAHQASMLNPMHGAPYLGLGIDR
jgi:hypothetical protein